MLLLFTGRHECLQSFNITLDPVDAVSARLQGRFPALRKVAISGGWLLGGGVDVDDDVILVGDGVGHFVIV